MVVGSVSGNPGNGQPYGPALRPSTGMVAIRGEFDGDDESGLVLRPHSEFGFEPLFVSDNGAANRPSGPEL